MEDYPKTLLELENRFKTEEACYEYLFKLRWPDGYVCPRCQNTEGWLTSRQLYKCSKCSYQVSVTAGTIFHRSKKPLNIWFQAIWHITSQKYGANALGLQRILGFGSYHTAWEWLHKLRRAMIRPGRERLNGKVVVDETYVGGEKEGKRGRGAEGKALVIVAVEDKGKKGIGRIRLQRVADASAESINSFIASNIEKGSLIKTDGWRGYNLVGTLEVNRTIVRSTESVGDNPLKLCHLVTALFKRWLLGTYQGAVKDSHLDYYLDEYTFRFNRRKSRSRGKLFYRLAQQAIAVKPTYGKDIESGSKLSTKPQHIGGS